MTAARFEVVLFDLGGVLIELGSLPIRMEGTAEPTDQEDWRRWLTSLSVRRFETGRSTPQEFGSSMVEEFGMGVEPEAFLEAFRDWPKGFFPGAEELLRGLAGVVRVACLSNSNPLHWKRFHEELGMAELFDHRFASHQIGSLKPDREVFDHVVAELGCPPGEVLFFDDNQMCVDGALAAGLAARCVQGVQGARVALEELKLLPSVISTGVERSEP